MKSTEENNEEEKEEIIAEYDQLNMVEEIRLAAIKEQAIILSEEINECCCVFHDRLRNGQVSGFTVIVAKLYYDIAYANYKYYHQSLMKDNLLSIKKYSEKSIQQFSKNQQITDRISIVKEAKYFLDSVCDLYFISNIEQGKLPKIPGNAVVLVKTETHEYISYFVENGLWVNDGRNLKYIRYNSTNQNINFENLVPNNKSGLVRKTENNMKDIENITKTAQLKRGRISVNVKYHKLIKKRKRLERNLEKAVLFACSIKEEVEHEASNTETSDDFSDSLKDLQSDVLKHLTDIIECNLEIGCVDEAEYYISILKNISGENSQVKLNEFILRKDLIIRLNQILESETALLLTQKDDIEYFIVKQPEEDSDYNKEIEKWEKNQCVDDNKSILLIYNPKEEQNHWESWFWIPKKFQKTFKLNIYENSFLSQFLKHIYSNKTTSLFFGELLDMLGDKSIFVNLEEDLKNVLFINNQFILESKRTKIIHSCELLAKAYEFIGHEPLHEHFNRILKYFSREKNKLLQEFSSSDQLNHHTENLSDKKQFPLSLFPISSSSAIKKLNDRINDKEFFNDILPHIDQINGLKRSLNFIYSIDWQVCLSQNNRQEFLTNWQKEYEKFKRKYPYEGKYLFLLIKCNFYLKLDFNEKKLPQIFENAIILTKTTQSSDDCKAYFVKDGFWIKDTKIGGLKSVIVRNINLENIQRDKHTGLIDKEKFEKKNRIEKLAYEMNLNRWYFYGEVAYGRVSEGFIDQKKELKPLEIYLKDIFSDDSINLDKESRILNYLSKIYSSETFLLSQEYFLEPISKIDYDKQISFNKGIRIYDLRKLDDGKNLKKQIQSDRKRNLSCIIKLSNKHYMTLFIENERPYQEKYSLRYINVLNSTFENRFLKKLKWFSGVIDQCVYKLHFIKCPKQKLMSENSFLHAYFNARACQWASENKHWEFLKKFFHRQEFSTKENIERIKEWFIENIENISISNDMEKEIPQDENFESIEKFKNLFLMIISSYFYSRDTKEMNICIEELTNIFISIKIFEDISESLCNISEREKHNQITECINAMKETNNVNTIVDMMFVILKEYSLNFLSFQEKFCQNLEFFEDRLHHAILSMMVEKSSFTPKEKYSDCAQQLKLFLDKSCSNSYDNSQYIKFLTFLEKFLQTEKISFDRTICQTLQQILKDDTNLTVNRIAKESFDRIVQFIQNFAQVEKYLKDFHQIFRCLLPYCYELLDIPTINQRLKDDVYNHISSHEQNFDQIKNCLNSLFQKIKTDQLIKIYFNIKQSKQTINEIFQFFMTFITNQDERSVHYIGTYLREAMMNRVDYYMKSLTSFRHKSLVSMELFEKNLHQFLLNSIRESIKASHTTNPLTSQAMSYLNSENLNYDAKISLYKKILQTFANQNSSIPLEVIDSVEKQLDNQDHSHSIYLDIKINDLKKMFSRFAKIDNVLPEFSQLFRQCLSEKYDHLSEQEVFSSNGKIKKEIFNCLKQKENFDDIRQLIQTFNHPGLINLVRKCEQFVKDNDEKASTEISDCLRQCIIDTTENYTMSLLTYRHQALNAFNHFEKNFHQLLSSYQAIQDKRLRVFIEQRLQELISLTNNDDYHSSLSTYRRILDGLGGEYQECARGLKEILKENNHILKPYFKQKMNNMKNLLTSYIQWYQLESLKQPEYVIFQIKTTSAILSEIFSAIKSKYPDCLCPNNEIRIINSNKLYIDIDLSNSEYSGVNIVIVSPYQQLVENKTKLTIITDGKDADDSRNNKPAQNGIGTDQNRNGNKGKDGRDGKPGKSAGHVYIVANKLPDMLVSACGGKGGRGQDGGNGAPGSHGKDGKDADKEALKKSLEKSWALDGGAWSYRSRRIGTDGQSGGWGGDAGSGGFRGEGGNPGLVKLVPLNDMLQEIPYKNLAGKLGSDDGQSGQPGEAGKHGKDGLDYVVISNWIYFCKACVTSRKIDHIKGGRLCSSVRYNLEYESEKRSGYDMLPMEADDDNFRFRNKYTDRSAEKGASMTQKHKNQKLVQKIHAINHEDIFQETSQFFDIYCNPQKSVSYQPWLAGNLNEFLGKMARLEGLPPYEVHTLPDIEHDAKQILILKEKFAEAIQSENQRLQSEKIDTDQMSIGIKLLGENILSEYNEFVQQYQIISQQLQEEIQSIDVNQLATGLDVRSVEIAKMRSTINRIINEQRFNQRLMASQRHTEVLADMSREELSNSIITRQNIQILKENNVHSEVKWKKFPIENNILPREIIEEFNKKPNEEILLKTGNSFLYELEKNPLEQKHLKEKISNFTNIYLYNLQQGNYTWKDLRLIETQKQDFYKILLQFQSLENTITLDLLISFCKGMQREYQRHYWLISIKKTLNCLENQRELKDSLLNYCNLLRVVDDHQLEQLDNKLKFSALLKEFPQYDFDGNFPEFIESMEKFNQNSSPSNLLEIFQFFSSSVFFDSKQPHSFQRLLVNPEQLAIMNVFLSILENNLSLININKNQFDRLTKQIVQIEEILIQYPRSYFSEIILDFSYFIEKLKMRDSLTSERSKSFNEIYRSRDLHQLLTFQTSKTYERKTDFPIEQQIDAFNSLYNPNLLHDIFRNLSTSKDIKNLLKDKKLIKFFRWTADYIDKFDQKTIENILQLVENILSKTSHSELQFLKIVFQYKKTKLENEKQEQNVATDTSLNNFLSMLNRCKDLFSQIAGNDEKAFEFYISLIDLMEFKDILLGSNEKLSEVDAICKYLLDNLTKLEPRGKFDEIIRNIRERIPSNSSEEIREIKTLIDQYSSNIDKVINYLKEKIKNINEQQKSNEQQNILLEISDELFFKIENLEDDIRILIAEKLYPVISIEQLNFCFFMHKIHQRLRKKLKAYFSENVPIKVLLAKELKTFFEKYYRPDETIEEILWNLALPFIDILNLYECNLNDKIMKTIKDLQKIQDENMLRDLKEKVLISLIISHPVLHKEELATIKTYMTTIDSSEGKQIENYQIMLSFLSEESMEKSEYVKEVYEGFYKYVSTSSLLTNFNQFNSLIQLMKLINQAHHDSLYPDVNNVDHARFQLTLLHILFEEKKFLGDINEQFIEFLFWLFQTLATYATIKETEEINIEMKYIEQLNKFTKKVEHLYKSKSQEKSHDYEYFYRSIRTISHEMKSIYLQKPIKILSEKYSNAKWLEIIIYFPEYLHIEIDNILHRINSNELKLIEKKQIDEIQEIIFQRVSLLQKDKLDQFCQLTGRDKLEKGFKEFNGYVDSSSSSFKNTSPYHALSLNSLIDTFNDRLELDNGLLIEKDIFIKIQQCLCCFIDLRLAIEKLVSSPQSNWLKTLLIEHIIETFSLIFPKENEVEDLRQMLMLVHEKVLFLLNNVFITQYIDQINQSISSKDNHLSDYQKIDRNKFFTIVQLLENIPATKQILDQLSDASLAVWDTLLYEMEFSRIFNREMNQTGINLSEDGIEKTLLYLNRIRVQLGTENNKKFVDFFLNISEKISQIEGEKNIQQLNYLLESIHYQKLSFEEANEIVRKFPYLDWKNKIQTILSSRNNNTKKSDRSADEIIEQMIEQQTNNTNTLDKDILRRIADETKLYRETAKKINLDEEDEKSYIHKEIQNILNLTSYQNNPEEYIRSHLHDIIPLILYTWFIANKPQFPKDTQIIALLLFIHSHDKDFIHSHDKGLIQQVRTGEGKTLIVGITAAFLALCGNAVDIVSSNRDLAIDGEKKCRSFFQLLKIESGHICNEDDDVNHQSYQPDLSTCQGNIVYGEVGAFQRDILEEEFNNKKIFGKRYLKSDNPKREECFLKSDDLKRKKCLIVDEADNMCLDKARHVLYLSHEIQSLKWLESVFIYIWTAVIRKEINNSDEISEYVEDITQFMKQNIENKNIFVPDYMKEFVNCKIQRWVNSAFQARIMREDDHFVLDISKTDEQKSKKQKTIIVLDKDTGVEQYSTRWSHGLAQFLELKYRRKLSVESLKAVFMSNKAFFQKYKHGLYGLTGTIGSENSQSFLSDLYQVRFAHLPTSKEKCFYQISNKISIEYGDWLDLIANESIEQAKKRPVLIICENVEATENIWNELIRHSVPPHTIEKYRRDGDNVEDRFAQKPATKGDIILATNKGGRGTDIHVDEQVNKDGGMHVILTYLPENVRVEEQAFGRTARNGAQGTGQYILLVNKSSYEDIYQLNQLTHHQRKIKLEVLSDVIIEREIINRDNKETARLSELKQKNILHLEVEEELFEKFNQFKKNISNDIFQKLFPEKSQKKFVDVFENILKNRWAFWLDEVKEEIDAIKTFEQKLNLLKTFDSIFINKFQSLLQVSSFDSLLEKFLNQPEEAIHIGKVCLSEKDFPKAKKCFEKGISSGDISGFSYIALAYCNINLESEEDIKKASRRYLKKAVNLLEAIKRNLMSNLKMAELLPQLATGDVFKKVSSKENLYQDQISGKLEVIGLHLHYLKQAVGETLEPFDFILHPKDEKNLTKEDYEKGNRLYDLLVKKGIIQGDRIRKIFRNNTKEREKMKKSLNDDLDPSIVAGLIELFDKKLRNKQYEFDKKDFEDIVCYNEQLWEILNIQNFQTVFILDKDRIEKELPQQYENIWKDIEKQIDVNDVKVSLFEDSVKKKNLRTYFEEKQILRQTKRVKIEELNIDSLNFPDKYAKIKFNDNGHEKTLKTFLKELIKNIREKSEYLYQTDLPFSTKEEEGNKVRIYLKEKNILQSGGLAKHKYETDHEKMKKTLDEILENTEFQNDKELIQAKIFSLQGDIRSYKGDLKASLKDFLDLPNQEIVPSELKYFEGLGLNKFLIIEEDKSWWDWNAFAVAMIGLAQVIAGAVLISFGLVNIGGALLSEGISDMIYATMAGLSGNFSWKDWAIQKAISFSLSIMCAGFGRLASAGNTVAKIGSVSRAAMIAKIVGKAATQYATTCLTNFLTEKIMEQIQESVIQKVVSTIEENFLQTILKSMKKKVESLYASSQNEQKFEKAFSTMKTNIEGALGRNFILPQQFDNIRVQLISSLQSSYHILTESLKKSNSKYTKLASNAIKATFMINELWNLVQSVLQFQYACDAFMNIIEGAVKNKNENVNIGNINDKLVQDRFEQLNSIIRGYISRELTKKLDCILRQIISGTLRQIGKAVAQTAKDMINSAFNGKNPVDILKQLNQNKSQVSVEQPIDQQSSKQEREEMAKREDLQNNIKNPKNFSENYAEEIKDKDRALGLADIKMLANSKARNITVINVDTGEKEVIRPSGLRRILAFFKQSAKINYKVDGNEGIGHYYTARGTETYKQINGRNDCLLIAYNESLGRTVNESMIQQERDKLCQYISRHPDKFKRYREKISGSGRDPMIGGSRQNPNWNKRFSNIRFKGDHNLDEQSSFVQNEVNRFLKNAERDIDNGDFKEKIESTVTERDGEERKNFKRNINSERKYPGSHQLTGPLTGYGTFDIYHDHSTEGRKTPGSTRLLYRYDGKNKRCKIDVIGIVDDHGDNVKPMKDIPPQERDKYFYANDVGVKKVNTYGH